jgi:hypothetical protein
VLGLTESLETRMIRWADQRFAHRFAGGPPPCGGRERARYEWREFGKAAIAIVGDGARTEELQSWIARLSLIPAIWPISHTLSASARRPSEQRG